MRVIATILLLLLAICLATPAILLLIDIWTWLIFGAGITPISWTYVGSSGHVDHVGKPILAILFCIPALPAALTATILGNSE